MIFVFYIKFVHFAYKNTKNKLNIYASFLFLLIFMSIKPKIFFWKKFKNILTKNDIYPIICLVNAIV